MHPTRSYNSVCLFIAIIVNSVFDYIVPKYKDFEETIDMAPGQLKSLLGSIRRRPTRAPDGKTDAEVNGNVLSEKTSIVHDLTHMSLKNAGTVASAITTLASGDPLDDKELMLEHGVSMLQTLPANSGLASTVSNQFIGMLWNDLPHPPPTSAGPTARYRRHDGGCVIQNTTTDSAY